MTSPQVQLGGLLGEAIDASRRGRLRHFISGPDSPAIALFAQAVAAGNHEGDWYGEHAGKWLVAAARAAARSGDAGLRANVQVVADFLCDQQQADGYLGTYAPERRFTVPQPPKPLSWDGAPALRTWDIWTHSTLILGLLEAHRAFSGNCFGSKGCGAEGCDFEGCGAQGCGAEGCDAECRGTEGRGADRWLSAARRIGDLCWLTVCQRGIDITTLGNHHGLSATVLIDPACELYFATGEPRYLALAQRIVEQADAHPPLAWLNRPLAGADAAEIGTGKAYQLAWNLVGLAKLQRATGRADLREVVDKLWSSIHAHHLTLGGGPWGGVGHRSREVFNAPGTFFPQAYVETCSTLAWMQLNRELLTQSDDPRYAEQIERSAYNDLLGAAAPNGEDWCYYSFPNGRRVHTTAWRCCKSSGALALEELPALAWRQQGAVLTLDLYGPGVALFNLAAGRCVRIEQVTRYPFDGKVTLCVEPQALQEPQTSQEPGWAPQEPQALTPLRFVLRLRCPPWAVGAAVQVGSETFAAEPGRYCAIDRIWSGGDQVQLHLPMPITVHRRQQHNVQESRAPDGSTVRQTVLNQAWLALTRGPLVYATGLIDGFKTEETLRLPDAAPDAPLEAAPDAPSSAPPGAPTAAPLGTPTDTCTKQWLALVQDQPLPVIRMSLGYRPPLDFTPYYQAGGREHGGWRLVWMSLAPAPAEQGPA